jgi:flagellar protein FlgJ
MQRLTRHLILGPLLTALASGAVLVVDAGMASAATSGTVRVSSYLKVRSAPTTSSALVGRLPNRTRVTITCKVSGQYVNGSQRSTSQWDRLNTGRYVSHAYISGTGWIPSCASLSAPPPTATAPAGPLATSSNTAFIASAVAPAQQSQREYHVPASVTIAQAILESGWGRSRLSANDRNYFGMKCFGGPGTIAVGCHDYATTECDAAGCYPTTASFKVYRNATDSFRDHGRLLATASRYRAAFGYTANPNRFVAEVHKGGYATDPNYTTKLVTLMNTYNLYRYDLR